MKYTCMRYPHGTSYSAFGSLLAWYLGDEHAQRLGKWIDFYCKVFKIDVTKFHIQYPT